jgi:uncharacterized protein YndB with AHSA1/START domain
MSKPNFVYTTYIRTTPQRLWRALTEPAFTRRYWGVVLESEWEPGSTLTWTQNGVTIADPEQLVLESEPYRHLVYTWHTFTAEWAEMAGFDDARLGTMAAEPRSKVTFNLEPVGDTVKLTVIHDGFPPGSAVPSSVSEGWPELLSRLKTLLETGEPLPADAA